jgi:hypothetical protein
MSAPAGWHPQDDGRERYWDGTQWTDQYRPGLHNGRTREWARGPLIAIVAAAIGSLGSLIGVVVANSNATHGLQTQLSHEDRVRKEDLRREAYERFVTSANTYLIDLERIVTADALADRNPTEAELKTIFDDHNHTQVALSATQFVGSEKAHKSGKVVLDKLDGLLNALSNGSLSVDDQKGMDTAEKSILDAMDAFVTLGRDELG